MKSKLLVLLSAAMVSLFNLSAASDGSAAAPSHARGPVDQTESGTDFGELTVRAYERVGLDREAALRAYDGAERRDGVLLALAEDAEFGGAWYAPSDDVLHVWSRNGEADDRFERLADERGVAVSTHRSQNSLQELEADSRTISHHLASVDPQFNGAVTADPTLNRLVVLVTPEWPESAARGHSVLERGDVVFVVADDESELDVCTSRNACGNPARAGVAVGIDADGAGSGSAAIDCSSGGTARVMSGGTPSRWMLTAGHCYGTVVASCPSAVGCLGHGQQYYGPIRQTHNHQAPYLNVDVARARIDNSYWSVGGYIYSQAVPNNPNPVKYNVEVSAVGQPACISARSGDDCGIITHLVNGAFNMIRVDTDSCDGDSGGLWFRNYASGNNRALGLHSASTTGCNVAGGASWYSGFNAIYSYWDDQNAGAILRLETQ